MDWLQLGSEAHFGEEIHDIEREAIVGLRPPFLLYR